MSKRSATSTKPGKASKASKPSKAKISTASTAPRTWGGARAGAGSGGTRPGAGRPRTITRYHLNVAPFFGLEPSSPPSPAEQSPRWYAVVGGLAFEFNDEERAKAFALLDLRGIVTQSLEQAERIAGNKNPLILSAVGRDLFRALAAMLAENRG